MGVSRCFTYFVQGERGGPIKIGKAVDAQKRLKELQTGFPYKLTILLVLEGNREAELHARFADARAHGEWFEPVAELLEFVASHQGEQALAGMGGLDSSPPANGDLPLLIRHLHRKYEADTWIDAQGLEDAEETASEVYCALEEFHTDVVGRGFSECDPDDGGCDPEGNCECERMMVSDAAPHLASIPLYGLILRKQLLEVIAVIRWPAAPGLRDVIQHEMEWAAFYLDAVEFQLHAILVSDDCTYTAVAMGDVYGGNLIHPRLPEETPPPARQRKAAR